MCKRLHVLVLLCLLLLLLPGCTRQQEPVRKLTVATYYGEQSALVLYAAKSGMFRKEGLNVTLLQSQSGVTATDAVINGTADIATAAEFVFVSKNGNAPGLRILCSVDESKSISMIALASSRIAKPADLRGKRIGVTRSSVAEYFLDRFLSDQGIASEEVVLEYLSPDKLLGALQNGSLDAVTVWNPVADQIRQRFADKVLSWSAQSVQLYHFVLVTDHKTVQLKPEALRLFLTALVKAEQEMRKNPPKMRKVVAKTLAVSPERLEKVWSEHDFGVRLNRSLVVALEMQTRWAMGKGMIPSGRLPNYLGLIELELLKQVNSQAVTIIH